MYFENKKLLFNNEHVNGKQHQYFYLLLSGKIDFHNTRNTGYMIQYNNIIFHYINKYTTNTNMFYSRLCLLVTHVNVPLKPSSVIYGNVVVVALVQ